MYYVTLNKKVLTIKSNFHMKLIPYFINVTKQAENKEPWHPTEMKHSAWYNRHKKSNNYSYSLHSEITSSASFSFTVTADCCIVMVNLDLVPAQHFRLRWCCCGISTSALPSPLLLSNHFWVLSISFCCLFTVALNQRYPEYDRKR